MLESQFENTQQSDSETMSQSESAEVIKLWAEKQRGEIRPGQMSVRDIAEGLDIPPEEARALLEEVRGRKEAFRELPVTFASSPPKSPLFFVGLAALGLTLLGLLAGSAGLSIFAGLILICALIGSRNWGLAGLALLAAIILIFGSYTFVSRSAPDVSSPAPTEVVTPVPTPEIPMPPPPSPQ